MEKEFKEITQEDKQEILDGWNDAWVSVTEKEMYSQGRWDLYFSKIYKHKPSETFWEFSWKEAATECQECSNFINMVRVYPHKVFRIEYKLTP